jgi:predicted dehydrogenase
VHDPRVGGGRIVGEVCHFVDFATFLAGAPPVGVSVAGVAGSSEPRDDNVVATLRLADGSVATVTYTSLGDPALSKERVEVVGEAGAGELDDFRALSLHRGSRTQTTKRARDKGHAEEVAAFVQACRTGEPPWPVADMFAVMRATFDIRDGLSTG